MVQATKQGGIMKGGYAIATLGSEGRLNISSNIGIPAIDDQSIIDAINSGKPILLYPNFIAGGHTYDTPFFALFSKSGTRIWEFAIGGGAYIIKYSTGKVGYSAPTATTELIDEDPYAMPAMEV